MERKPRLFIFCFLFMIAGTSSATCETEATATAISQEQIISAISTKPIPQDLKNDIANFSEGKIELNAPSMKQCLNVAHSCYILGDLNSSEKIYLHLLNLASDQDAQTKELLKPVINEASQGLTHLYYQAGCYEDAVVASSLTASKEFLELITYSACSRGMSLEKVGLTMDFLRNKVNERYQTNEAYLIAYLRMCLRGKTIPKFKIVKVTELKQESAVKAEMITVEPLVQEFSLTIGAQNLSTLYYLMGDYKKAANEAEKLINKNKLPTLEAISQAIRFSQSKQMLGNAHLGSDLMGKIREESGKVWKKINIDALMEVKTEM